MRIQYAIAFALMFLWPLAGCRAIAVGEARGFVTTYESYLESTPAKVEPPHVARLVDKYAEMIRSSAEQLEQINQDNPTWPKLNEFDVFDSFSVAVIHSMYPNAATPGDNVAYVTTRMFLDFESPEQLLAVLAHEFGHMRLGHTIDQAERRITTEIAMAVVAGIGAGLEGAISPSYTVRTDWTALTRQAMAVYNPYRKQDEFEADLYGLDVYHNIGLDPAEYISLFEMMLTQYGDSPSKSHPKSSERIDALRQYVSKNNLRPSRPALSARELMDAQLELVRTIKSMNSSGMLISHEETANKIGASSLRIPSCGAVHLTPDQLQDQFLDLLNW